MYGYDANGNPTTVTNPLGHVTTSVYDARNRLISVTEHSGGGTTTYTYEHASRLASVTDSVSNVTGYAYDAQGRLIDEVDPRSLCTTYVYDASDNLTSTTDRLGRTTSSTYDADNRETTETWLLPGGSSAYLLQIFRDYGGRVTGVADNFSQYNDLYDDADRLTSVSDLTATGMPHVTFTYSYDNDGNRTSMADSLGGLTSDTYDARDELTKITQSGTGVANKRVDFLDDPAGQLTTLKRYSDLSGTSTALVSKYAYDVADRLTTLTNQTSGGTVWSSYVYGYDNADRLTAETRTWGSGSTDTLGYSYTNNDKLTGVTHTNGSFANETFGYDANGNRNTTGYTTAAANQTTSDGTYTYTYDAEGNLTAKTNISTGNQTLYVWDARNRLVEVDQVVSGVQTTLAQYTYDAFNNPIKVVEAGSTRYTLYDGQTPVLDFDASSTLTAPYLNGPAIDDGPRPRDQSRYRRLVHHRLGTVRDLVNNSGNVIDHVDYSVYGTILSESSPSTGDRFKYAAMELDGTTGLYYDRARWYDSVGGKFVGQDPIALAGRDANFYRYVGNDVNMIDPTGMFQDVRDTTRHLQDPYIVQTPYPTGKQLREMPQVVAEAMEALAAVDGFERATGVYQGRDGEIITGRPIIHPGRVVEISQNPGNLRADKQSRIVKGRHNPHTTIDMTPLGNLPDASWWRLVATIHTHPPAGEGEDPSITAPNNYRADRFNVKALIARCTSVP